MGFVRMCEEVRGLGGLAWESEVSAGKGGRDWRGGWTSFGERGWRSEERGWKSWGEGIKKGLR